MNRNPKIVKGLITVAYLILIGLLVFEIFALSNQYNKEEMRYITEIERNIKQALESKSRDEMVDVLSNAYDDYKFDIVIVDDNDTVMYKTIPYEVGDNLLNRLHTDVIARQSQGNYTNEQGKDMFVWYSVYRLKESNFITRFLMIMLIIIIILTLLFTLTLFIMTRSVYKPLKTIARSIGLADRYDFEQIESSSDSVNRQFDTFVNKLQSDISAVSRQHTQLEMQLQAKRDHLTQVVDVSKNMMKHLEKMINNSASENIRFTKQKEDNEQLLELAILNQSANQELIKQVDEILKMLDTSTEEVILELTEVDVVDLTMKVLSKFHKQMFENNLRVNLEAPLEAYTRVEETTLKLLLNNVFSNIVLYGLEHTEVDVLIEDKQEETHLIFINQSNEDNIKHLMSTKNLFNAVKSEVTDDYVYRSGNGLYLIKELTEMMGGHYTLETTSKEVKIILTFRNKFTDNIN